MCRGPEYSAYQADSGYINSNNDLGINSPSGFAINYRKVTTCAPLVTDNFMKWQDTEPGQLAGDQNLRFYYGPSVDEPYTFTYDSYEGRAVTTAYQLYVQSSLLGSSPVSSFTPILPLNRTDADVNLIFLMNWAQYTKSFDDAWFNASTSYGSHYGSQSPASVLGCTEQYQFCNPTNGKCTDLTGFNPSFEMANETLGVNEEQLWIARLMQFAFGDSLLNDMVNFLGSSALQASLYIANEQRLESAPLNKNQWIQEVQGFQAYMMAHVQRMTLDYATGPSNPNLYKYLEAPNNSNFNACANTKIRQPNFYNFSMFGLLFIVVCGITIFVVDLSLPTVVGWTQRVTKKGLQCRQDWIFNQMLQVQRIAFEQAGIGHWKGGEPEVPVTEPNEELPKLPTPGTPETTAPLSPSSPYTPESRGGYPVKKETYFPSNQKSE